MYYRRQGALVVRFQEESGSYLDLVGPRGILVRFTYGLDVPKPTWTHLYTLSGDLLTLHRPFDHLHHRGMMLTWSDVNGFNFWEENRGPEVSARIVWRRWLERFAGRDEAWVAAELDWPDPTGRPLLRQRLGFGASPMRGSDGAWLFQVDAVFEALDRSVSFRTPPVYNGLGLRLARSMNVKARILNSLGGLGEEGTRGIPAAWCDYSGHLDDGGGEAGVTVISHPRNDRHPVAFHTLSKQMAFISAAPTYAEGRELAPGQAWPLSYAVVVHAGTPSAETCAAWAADFSRRESLLRG
jgi:hypothetical protein